MAEKTASRMPTTRAMLQAAAAAVLGGLGAHGTLLDREALWAFCAMMAVPMLAIVLTVERARIRGAIDGPTRTTHRTWMVGFSLGLAAGIGGALL